MTYCLSQRELCFYKAFPQKSPSGIFVGCTRVFIIYYTSVSTIYGTGVFIIYHVFTIYQIFTYSQYTKPTGAYLKYTSAKNFYGEGSNFKYL